jgi:hypothetical protein
MSYAPDLRIGDIFTQEILESFVGFGSDAEFDQVTPDDGPRILRIQTGAHVYYFEEIGKPWSETWRLESRRDDGK